MTKNLATLMTSIKRRHLLGGAVAASLIGGLRPAFALSSAQAIDLVNQITNAIFSELSVKRSGNERVANFERIFIKYADVPRIAQQALGAPWRSATKPQKKAYVRAFSRYMAHSYGRRFEGFTGAKVKVGKSEAASRGQLVNSIVTLKDQQSYDVQWLIIEGRGGIRMLNLYIEGVSALSDVRVQIGTILDKNGGDIDKLIAHLSKTKK